MTRQWRKGPPPEIGWWPASVDRDPFSIRWWDGNFWSFPCWPEYTKEVAAARATIRSGASSAIEWTARWWL